MQQRQDAAAAIAAADRIAITAHVRPDGDAIGAALGLKRILTAVGKPATIVGMDPVPQRYAFLMQDDIIVPASETTPDAFDLLVVLDTGAPDRMPAAMHAWLPLIRTLNIDHHPTNTEFGTINWVNPEASSAGEMISELHTHVGYPLTPPAAEALWVSLITDTGRFAYSNTRPATLRAAAALLKEDIKTDPINTQIYNTTTVAQIRLQGRAIEHLQLHEDGQVALVSLSREDFAAFNCTGEDAEDIVDIARRTGAAVAIFLYELSDHGPRETKASFRTAEPFDAAALCRELGGGGHARAAGCTLPLPLPEARNRLLEMLHDRWFTTP